jgi:hypothetical protein
LFFETLSGRAGSGGGVNIHLGVVFALLRDSSISDPSTEVAGGGTVFAGSL